MNQKIRNFLSYLGALLLIIPTLITIYFVSYFLDYLYYGANRPVFFEDDVKQRIDDIFENKINIIQQEFLSNVKMNQIPSYHNIDPVQHTVVTGNPSINDPTSQWRSLALYVGGKIKKNCQMMPQTYQLIRKVPGLRSAMISVLDPMRDIPKHRGIPLYRRYHLGIIIPEKNTPQLFIHDYSYTWKEGESILFDDSHPHGVTNCCKKARVILMIDVHRHATVLGRCFSFMTFIIFWLYGKLVKLRGSF